MSKNITVIKIGGKAFTDDNLLFLLAQEISGLLEKCYFIIVHGGGAEVSKVSKIFGIKPEFIDGIRMTGKEEMNIVDMVLSGKINNHFVRLFSRAGLKPVGLSGSDGNIFTGKKLHDKTNTGKITCVDTSLLKLILKAGYLPVVSSCSMDCQGNPLNINADEAALGIASNITADNLLFISDVPGIVKNNSIIPGLNKVDAEKEIESGVISRGMIPKVRSSIDALENGVKKIIIGQYCDPGDIDKLFSGALGTKIT